MDKEAAKAIVALARQGVFHWETRAALEWGTDDDDDYWELQDAYQNWEIQQVAQWCRDHPEQVGCIVCTPNQDLIRPGYYLTKVNALGDGTLYLESLGWYRQALIQDVQQSYAVFRGTKDYFELLHPRLTCEGVRYGGLTPSDFDIDPGQFAMFCQWISEVMTRHPAGTHTWPEWVDQPVHWGIAERAYTIIDW